MTNPRGIDAAYGFCRAIARKHGPNVPAGVRLLSKARRRAVYAAYAFWQFTHDVADERLDAWQSELENCYEGRPLIPITIALADAVERFPIPKRAFLALIDGRRQDMVKTRYETFDELLAYCDLAATPLSDIALAIFGHRTAAAPRYGRSLAIALQLTNVTRGIGDDLARDRIYIPQEELRLFGVTEAELFARAENDRVRKLIDFQIDRAEGYFREAEPLLGELSFDARLPALSMGAVHATVLAKLRKNPLMAIRKRLSLSTARKLLAVGSRVLRPHFLA